jgi:hypothetical protein
VVVVRRMRMAISARHLTREFCLATSIVAFAGCGSSANHDSTASPPTARVPVAGSVTTSVLPNTTVLVPGTTDLESVILTASDNGHTFVVAPGQTVIVILSTGELWEVPRSSDSSVLRRSTGDVDAATGNATANFVASAPGSARITSAHRCRPVVGRDCPMYVALWSVTVSVS